MKKKNCLLFSLNILAALLITLSGCGCRVIEWGKCWANQGEKIPDYCHNARTYIRSISIYDQFTRLGMFNALWLSDEVRTAYVDICTYKAGKNVEQRTTMLRRQLAENEHYITFIVLSCYDIPLKEKDAIWSIGLEISGVYYSPVEVKAIDLNCEYQEIFGPLFNKFRVPYMVRFSAYDNNKCPLVNTESLEIKLIFRSSVKECALTWCLQSPCCCPCKQTCAEV